MIRRLRAVLHRALPVLQSVKKLYKVQGMSSMTRQTDVNNSQTLSAPLRRRSHYFAAPAREQVSGNQAMQRLLRSGATKPNLIVSQPGDRYEREADRVADEVMRMSDSTLTGPAGVHRKTAGDSIQRMCTECEEQVQRQPLRDEEEESIQAKGESDQTPEIPPVLQENLSAIRGSGLPLSEPTREFFEPRFGADFTGVRVHTDVTAAQTARAIRARAFTSGHDIVFANGEYDPGTPKGNHLLAHELTHTIQQEGKGAISSGEPAQVQRAVDFEDLFSDFPLSEPEPPTTNEETIQDSPDVSFRIFPAEGEVPVGEEEAAVQRTPSDGTGRSGSPEHEAATETAYPTGMSGGALASALKEGQPLEAGVRSSLESRYGSSLEHVRIHDDADAASLSTRFAARAFTYGNHIAFGEGAYAPKQPEGEHLLRHEVTHVLKSQPSAQGVYRANLCPLTCEPAGALPFVPVSDSTFNCYSYALNSPASRFLLPGQRARTAEFIAMATILSNPLATTAQKATTLPYFTVAGVKTNTEADIGSAVSSDCNVCCSGSNRKVIEFATDSATTFKRIAGPGGAFNGWQPMVSSSERWDFHWYRKDADGAWSHKHGGRDAQRADESGTTPLCNPCTADRNFGPNYKNVVGSWCI